MLANPLTNSLIPKAFHKHTADMAVASIDSTMVMWKLFLRILLCFLWNLCVTCFYRTKMMVVSELIMLHVILHYIFGLISLKTWISRKQTWWLGYIACDFYATLPHLIYIIEYIGVMIIDGLDTTEYVALPWSHIDIGYALDCD